MFAPHRTNFFESQTKMVEQITLYSAKVCPWAHRTELALKESGLPYKRYEIDLANKPEWYAPKVNPASKVPALAYGGPDVDPAEPSPDSVNSPSPTSSSSSSRTSPPRQSRCCPPTPSHGPKRVSSSRPSFQSGALCGTGSRTAATTPRESFQPSRSFRTSSLPRGTLSATGPSGRRCDAVHCACVCLVEERCGGVR